MSPAMLSGARRAWDSLWFREVPPDSYAVLRVVFGLLGFVSLVGFTPASMYWPLDGLAPIPTGGGLRSYLHASGVGTVAGWMVFASLWVSFLCMTIGLGSRWAVAACFTGSVFQTFWNSLPLSSAHSVLVAVLFCLLWADSSGAPSVDAIRRGRGASPGPQPIWPLYLIRVQVALIYFNSGLWKLMFPVWRDGTAVYYATNHNVFRRFPSLPTAIEPLLMVGTYVTLFWEVGFPFMVLHRRLRAVALGVGVLLHLGMWAMLELGPFSWLMIASYIAFIDPVVVSRLVTRGSQPVRQSDVTSAHGH